MRSLYLRIYLTVVAALALFALVSGWLLAFTLSLDDLVTSSFVSGPGATTLPMVIYSKVRLGLSPEINALATILLVVVGASVTVAPPSETATSR